MDAAQVQGSDAPAFVPEVAPESLSDAELAQGIAGIREGNETPEIEQEAEPQAPQGGGITPEPLPTVETLQKELREIKEQYTKTQKHAELREKTLGRQSAELGELRKLREKLLERKAQLEQADPHKTFIEDPRAFQANLLETQKVEQALEKIAQGEQAAVHRARRSEGLAYLQETAPDLPSNIPVIESILRDMGDSEEAIQAFKTDPLSFPPQIVRGINEIAKARLRIQALEAENAKLKEKPGNLLDQIQKTARQPLTNSSGLSTRGGKPLESLSDADISKLSDKDLSALIEQIGKKG